MSKLVSMPGYGLVCTSHNTFSPHATIKFVVFRVCHNVLVVLNESSKSWYYPFLLLFFHFVPFPSLFFSLFSLRPNSVTGLEHRDSGQHLKFDQLASCDADLRVTVVKMGVSVYLLPSLEEMSLDLLFRCLVLSPECPSPDLH